MYEKTRDLLNEVIDRDLAALDNLEVGSKERNEAIKGLAILMEKMTNDQAMEDNNKNEEEKLRIDKKYKEETLELEKSKSKIDRGRAALEIIKILAPAGISFATTIWLVRTVLKYEETGSIHSSIGRQAIRLPNLFKGF